MNETIVELRRHWYSDPCACERKLDALKMLDRLEQLEAENARLIDQNTENGLMAYEWHVKADREEKRAGQYEKALRCRLSPGLHVCQFGTERCIVNHAAEAREALAQADSAKEERGE